MFSASERRIIIVSDVTQHHCHCREREREGREEEREEAL